MNDNMTTDAVVELDLQSATEITGGEDTIESCILNNWDRFKASFVSAFSKYDI